MKQYFYIDSNKQQIGPLAEDALMVLMRCGAIYRQTLIWTEGLTDWMPFGIVFPECAKEVSPTPIAVESSTAALDFPVDEELLEQLKPLLPMAYRDARHLAIFFTCFALFYGCY